MLVAGGGENEVVLSKNKLCLQLGFERGERVVVLQSRMEVVQSTEAADLGTLF